MCGLQVIHSIGDLPNIHKMLTLKIEVVTKITTYMNYPELKKISNL